MIARLKPRDSEALRRRTHAVEVLGFAATRSRGIKSGVVVDLEEAEKAIRLAVDAAERMAEVTVGSLIVNISCRAAEERDLLRQRRRSAAPVVGGRHPARARRRRRAFGERRAHGAARAADRLFARRQSRPRTTRSACSARRSASTCMSSPPTRRRSAISSSPSTAATSKWRRSSPRPTRRGSPRSSTTRRSSASPASTWAAARPRSPIFHDGEFVHADAIAIGGQHVTLDIARGLSTNLADAERLKARHGSALVLDLRRARHPDHPAGRRGRARPSEHRAALGADPHHPAARRGDAGDDARHAGEVRLRRRRSASASC